MYLINGFCIYYWGKMEILRSNEKLLIVQGKLHIFEFLPTQLMVIFLINSKKI